MKKEAAKKAAPKPKAAPAKLKDLQPKKDAKGGYWHPPSIGGFNHNETLVCETEV
jgi:hypothetical protein